jgi:hypothetical protein
MKGDLHMKRSVAANHARKETAAATVSRRKDNLSFLNSADRFFGENVQPAVGRGKDAFLLEICERYLEYSRGRAVR